MGARLRSIGLVAMASVLIACSSSADSGEGVATDAAGAGDTDALDDGAAADVSIDDAIDEVLDTAASTGDSAPIFDACAPSCTGKGCGADGCGGTCGTCAAGSTCTADGKCLPTCPCWGGDCTSCYCGQGVKDYGAAHGCTAAPLAGHDGDLLSCTKGVWSVGTTCTAGCNVMPDKTPDTCKSPPSTASHKLWVAFDSSTVGCRANTENFFQCLLGRTDFGDLEKGYSTGRVLGWGGSAVLGKNCGFVHDVASASVAADSATFQCIEDQTGWDLHADDLIMYYPTHAGCRDGRNHWHIPVTSHGAAIKIEVGLGFTSNVCSCQTALGMHEVFEASADPAAADCCNGQTWSPLHGNCSRYAAPSYGWYSLTCGGATYQAQLVSVASNMLDASGCTKVVAH